MMPSELGGLALGPALAVGLGLPLVLLVMTEAIQVAGRRGHPVAGPLRWTRNWFMPVLALVLFLRVAVGLPGTNPSVRLAETVLWIFLAAGALNFINSLVFEAAAVGSWATRVPRLLRDLIRILLVGLAAAVVYSTVWGKDLSGALAALGVSSIVVGLALQEPLGNLFSGVMLLMERPFEVGDHIEIGDFSGEVKEINWRSAHLKSFGGLTRVVPNSVLNKEVITNYSRPRRMRMEMIEVSFSYDDAPNDVRDTLLAVAAETPGVIAAPAPIAATLNFGDFGIAYRLIYRTLEEDRWPVRGELMTRIWYAARRRGLNMPYPVSVSLNYEQKGVFGRTPPRARDLLAGLGRFPDLSGVTDEALETLDFAHKEVLFREGTPLTGVMVLVRGEISLQTGEGEGAVEIARASPGEIFGESGMYGRQASSLSAVALKDCLVVRMAPDAISQVFEKSPVLAREVGQVVEARRSSAQAARESRRKT